MKLDRTKSLKEQFRSGGVFMVLLSVPVFMLFSGAVGLGMLVIGILMALAGAFAE